MTGRRRALAALMLACTAGTAACAVEVPGTMGRVTTMDVRVVVHPDGNIDVTETTGVTADGSGQMTFTRVVKAPQADAVTFQSASIDGGPVAPGGSEFMLATPDGTVLQATWRREQAREPIVLGLTYAAASAVAVTRPRGSLEWPVLLPMRDFAVDDITITLELPEGAGLYEGTGMAEAGWTVEVGPGRLRAHRSDVAASEPATLLAVFDIDKAQVQQGTWEWNRDRGEQYFLALISAGLFILVIGAGILAQLRAQYPPVPPEAPDDVRRAASADRQMLSRGLWLSAVISLVAAVLSALAAQRWLAGLGLAVHAIPVSVAVLSGMFAIAAWWYGRSTK